MKVRVEDSPARTDLETLMSRLGLTIRRPLLEQSLTHRSFAHEAGGIPTNERLEFLGDAVLGIIVTEHLYRKHPDVTEGELAKMRAATVSQRALAEVARTLGLGEYMLLGRGELVTRGRDKDSILSDTLEAIIGAAYLENGLEPTRVMVEGLCAPLLAHAARLSAGLDWKTSLQELAGIHGLPTPLYRVEGSGPDHDRTFSAQAIVGSFVGTGTGSSKKVAEHAAAEAVYEMITGAYGSDA